MANGVKANVTKKAIEGSLRKLLLEKPLDEITVKDLVEDCGIARQTFYYHFQDIYAVVEWRFQNVTQELLEQTESMGRKEASELLIKMMRENKSLLINTYRAFDRAYIERYLSRWIKPHLSRIVREQAKNYRIEPGAVEFIEDIYVFILVNVLLNWVDRGMVSGMVERLDYFYILLEHGMDDAMRHFSR